MRIYIKGDYNRKVPFGYRELAWKMWFKERKGQKISFSHVGDDEMLQDDFYLSLRLDRGEQVALVGKRSRLKVAVQLIPKYMKILIWIMQEVMKVTVEKRENI